MRSGKALLWLSGCAIVTALLAARIVAVLRAPADLRPWFCDFANLWAAGHFVGQGAWARLYDPAVFTAWQEGMFGPVMWRVFSYPPTFYPAAQLVALMPYRLALLAWIAGTGALFLWATRRWWPAGAGPFWLAALTPAALLNVHFGQSGFLLAALWLAIFALLERRPVLAGLLTAAFVAKPQIAVLIPLILALRGQWRAFAVAGVGTTGAVVASVAVYGIEPWRQFIGVALPRQAAFVDGASPFADAMTTSTVAMLRQWHVGWAAGWAVHALVAGWALWVVVSAIRDCAAIREVAMLGATATFLVLPYALAYDLIVPAIAAWAIVCDPQADRRARWLAGIGFVAPQIAYPIGLAAGPVLPLALVAQLYAQHRVRVAWISRPAAPAGAAAAR